VEKLYPISFASELKAGIQRKVVPGHSHQMSGSGCLNRCSLHRCVIYISTSCATGREFQRLINLDICIIGKDENGRN